MDDATQTLGDLAARIVVRLAAKPVDVARRRKRKRAVDEANGPSLPITHTAGMLRQASRLGGPVNQCVGSGVKGR